MSETWATKVVNVYSDPRNFCRLLTRSGLQTSETADDLHAFEWSLRVQAMPVIQIIPIESHKLKLQDTLRTPVYVTSQRRNAMGVGLVFEADLHTTEHTSHWILQGVCLILNTD